LHLKHYTEVFLIGTVFLLLLIYGYNEDKVGS